MKVSELERLTNSIIRVLKIILPSQNKWLVTTLVLSGLTVLIKPWWEPLVMAIFGKQGYSLPDTSWVGWSLLALGIGIHFLNRYQEYFEGIKSVSTTYKKDNYAITNLNFLTEEFGAIIETFRKNQNITEAEFASLIDENLNGATIETWEKGEKFPVEVLPQLLDVIGMADSDFDAVALKHLSTPDLALLKKNTNERKSLQKNIALLRRTLLLGAEDRTEPIYIIAPYSSVNSQFREQSSPNYVFVDNLGDRDSLLDLTITLARLYPLAPIKFLHSEMFSDGLFEKDLILLGGIGYPDTPNNHAAKALIEEMNIPLTYQGNNLIFGDNHWSSKFSNGSLTFDVGFFANVRNPWNKSKRVLSIQGIHTSGVLGCVRAFSLNPAATENHILAQKLFGTKEYCAIFPIRLFGSRPVISSLKPSDFFELPCKTFS